MRLTRALLVMNVALVLGFLAGYLWRTPEIDRLRREAAHRPDAAPSGMRTSTARGIVRAVLPSERLVVITHEALPGLMGSMTMAFRATEPRLLTGLNSGDRVQFTVQEIDKELRLVDVRRTRG